MTLAATTATVRRSTVRRATTAVRGSAAAVISGEGMFTTAIVRSVAHVALVIMRLVRVEVVELLCPARGQRSVIPMMRIIAIVDMAIKPVGTVEPGTSSNEHPTRKPIRTIVPIGCAIIRSVVKVPVGAYRCHSNVDGNLGWG
jgi:hypothetical protein